MTMQEGVSYATLDLDTPERFQLLRRELGITSFGMNLILLAPRQQGRIHRHERQEEVYLVLDGVLTLAVEGEERELARGELARVAPMVRRRRCGRALPRAAEPPLDAGLRALLARGLQETHAREGVGGRQRGAALDDLQPAVAHRHRGAAQARAQLARRGLDDELGLVRGELVAPRLERRRVVDAGDDDHPPAAQRPQRGEVAQVHDSER